MFGGFFFYLRGVGLKVGLNEWLTLIKALSRGHERASLAVFYHLARSILVKRETHYDLYDRAFAAYFGGVEEQFAEIDDVILEWLSDPQLPRDLTDEERAQLKQMDLETLRQQFEQRLQTQRERHDGGNRFIGTGGTSPFGHGGQNPQGMRVGGSGGGRSAVQLAEERRFENLRGDRVLDTRSIGQALRRLRKLARDAGPEELDVDETIDKSARNAEIELVMRPPRRNRVKLLLLMDVGGSMDPYAELCERLFSAAHQSSHFAAFKHYFFHNCVYDRLYEDITRYRGPRTDDVLKQIDRTWTVVLVGDAWMGPFELTHDTGGIYWGASSSQRTSGLDWLKRIARIPKAAAWLNPEPKRIWNAQTVSLIRRVFPMFELTLDGLGLAVDHLRGARPVEVEPGPVP